LNQYLRSIVGGLAIAMTMSAAYAQADDAYIRSFDAPNVYVMSNDINANSVAVLKRDFFGGLNKVAVVPTGGKGVGVGTTAPPPDPLGSQNALLKSQDGRWLYAVNAGSDQISVFAILQDSLQLVDVVASGGTYPVSLAQRGNRLFVLNSAGVASVNVFEIGAAGDLYPVANETRVIGTNQPLVTNQPNVGMTPAQLQFTPDGKWLVVSVKDASAKGYFELFGADRQGNLAQDPVISLSNDAQPFGFAFDDNGHLISSESADSAASSYAVDRDGSLTAISADVLNGQAATCWLAVSGH
jgi:6-phosphogluconolactonase (cycloisomerase 2 family)